MKKLFALLLALSMMMTMAAGLAEDAAPALQKNLVILFTSDVHCGVEQNWGAAGLYALRQKLEADGNYTLLVDDGDYTQGEPMGTMTQGEALIDIMNATGYDIAIPGNHDFDYGMDAFLAMTKKAKFPYISANFEKDGELVFPPYVIKEFDGVKFAFVGATTPMTLTTSTPRYFQDEAGNWVYDFMQDGTGEKFYAGIQKAVDDARAEGANYVFIMAHLGNEAEASPYRYDDLITHITGVDALMDGHAHDYEYVEVKDKEGKIVLRQAVGTKMDTIGALTVSTDGKLSMKSYTWPTSDFSAADLGITNPAGDAAKAASGELKETLETVVAHSNFPLVIYDPEKTTEDGKKIRIVRMTETNLGDLCADAYMSQSGADIAWVNGGGIRVDIPAGDITLNDILKVHPFGNAMCIVEVTGQQILDALEWNSRAVPGECGGFLQVAGLTYEIHTYIPSSVTQDENSMFTGVAGEYRVKNVKVGGEDLDLNKTYRLASHDYMLLSDGDGNTMFRGAKLIVNRSMLDNQVLINYITQDLHGEIPETYADPYGQGRIVAVEEAP